MGAPEYIYLGLVVLGVYLKFEEYFKGKIPGVILFSTMLGFAVNFLLMWWGGFFA